jgi:hypothetical protein
MIHAFDLLKIEIPLFTAKSLVQAMQSLDLEVVERFFGILCGRVSERTGCR